MTGMTGTRGRLGEGERGRVVLINILRGCSIKCVKVRKVIINNFDHGKERDEEKREAIAIE
jgi:hypothetical protein